MKQSRFSQLIKPEQRVHVWISEQVIADVTGALCCPCSVELTTEGMTWRREAVFSNKLVRPVEQYVFLYHKCFKSLSCFILYLNRSGKNLGNK